MWTLYLLQCSDRSIYTGTTTDLTRRLEEHRVGRGARYTKTRRPVKLLHTERFRSRSSAQRREAQIKQMPRRAKLALIKGKASV